MLRQIPNRWFVLAPLTLLAACSSDASGTNNGDTGGSTSSISGSSQGGAAGAAGALNTLGGYQSGDGGSGGTSTSGGAGAPASAGAGSGGVTGGIGGASGAAGNTTSAGSSGLGGTSAGGSANGDSAGAGGSSHTGPWKIMALGDSITGYCYPQNLAGELAAAGKSSKVSFIGTVTNNQGCNSPTVSTLKTEGHGCYLVTYLERDITTVAGCDGTKGTLSELKTWAAEKPDVVLMEIATNDVWGGRPNADIMNAYSFVVDHFRAENPKVLFFVAQITPMNPGSSSGGKVTISCTECEGRVESLNAAIPGWATGKSSAASPIYVVNVWSALDKSTYLPGSSFTSDGVHPAPPAAKLMADKWYAALSAHGIP